MSGRAGAACLDRVQVETPRGIVVISWRDREVLLRYIPRDIALVFYAVGATRPVVLTDAQRARLLDALNEFNDDDCTDRLRELRAALSTT